MMTTKTLARAALLVAAFPLVAAAQRDGDRVDTTLTLAPNGLVQLTSTAGEVRVTGESRSDVRLRAEIERGRLETSFSGERISLSTRSVGGRQSGARINVAVPKGTRVSVRTVSGVIEVRATDGPVTVRTTSGEIDVRDASDRVEVSTVSGRITMQRVRGNVLAEGVSSTIRVTDVDGQLGIETVSGSINVTGGRLDGLSARTTSGSVTYEGSISRTGTFRLNTHSGSVTMVLPSDVGAALELETFSGRINSEFPLTMQPGETGGRRGRRMEFTLGDGGARVTAGAFSGNITIRRGSAAGDRE